jgi:NAD(P)-dependent dehydrogenase (short-subunit alcohol dehydrogenase family)
MNYLDTLFNLKGKVAVLTGGGGVLAGEMAKGLASCGVKVVLLDLRLENAQKCADKLIQLGGEAIALQSNVLSKEILEETKDIILAKFGRIDILINAAGGNMPGATISPDKTFFDLQFDDFKKVTDLNLNGTVLPTMVFGEVMACQRSGNIINIASMASLQAITRIVGYSAAKAAVVNFTKWSAMEMAQKFSGKIRVNAIAPGFFYRRPKPCIID